MLGLVRYLPKYGWQPPSRRRTCPGSLMTSRCSRRAVETPIELLVEGLAGAHSPRRAGAALALSLARVPATTRRTNRRP